MSTTRIFNSIGTGIFTGLAMVGGVEFTLRAFEASVGECILKTHGVPQVVSDAIIASLFGITAGVFSHIGNKGFFGTNPSLEEESSITDTPTLTYGRV